MFAMDLKQQIKNYLKDKRVMQLATSSDNQPWVCSIHFYMDAEFNFYWISSTSRRHSKDVVTNKNVSATILIHEDTTDEPYVVGISTEGKAKLVDRDELKVVVEKFAQKFNKPTNFVPDNLNGRTTYKFYCFKPTKLVLFDNKTYPDKPRQEVEL
jgi:uncharacterized protein YhbP (UPF0306 family)